VSSTHVPGVPFALEPVGDVRWRVADHAVAATAAPRTDVFADPAGGPPVLSAARLVGELPDGDFQLRCRVTVDIRSTFDAGVLLLWFDDAHWAKLCLEGAPDGQPMVVSVVNRTVSDDANAVAVHGRSTWLRVSRTGSVFAFHASVDGTTWRMVRLFALDVPGVRPRLGFEVQSPTGDGCEVAFSEIEFAAAALADPRNGS